MERDHPGQDWYTSERFRVSDCGHWTAGVDRARSDRQDQHGDDDWSRPPPCDGGGAVSSSAPTARPSRTRRGETKKNLATSA